MKVTFIIFFTCIAVVVRKDYNWDHSPVLHCASLLRIIPHVISAQALENDDDQSTSFITCYTETLTKPKKVETAVHGCNSWLSVWTASLVAIFSIFSWSDPISFPEPTCLMVSTKTRTPCQHSGQTTGHSREHARVWAHPVTSPLYPTKFPRSTSATRAISVLSSIILPVQTFFSRVLLLR